MMSPSARRTARSIARRGRPAGSARRTGSRSRTPWGSRSVDRLWLRTADSRADVTGCRTRSRCSCLHGASRIVPASAAAGAVQAAGLRTARAGGGAVALLADDDFGDVLLLRRHVLAVDARAIEEEDDVGVLLEGARVVAHDAVGEPGFGTRHRQIEHVLVARGPDLDDAVPGDVDPLPIAVCVVNRVRIVPDRRGNVVHDGQPVARRQLAHPDPAALREQAMLLGGSNRATARETDQHETPAPHPPDPLGLGGHDRAAW